MDLAQQQLRRSEMAWSSYGAPQMHRRVRRMQHFLIFVGSSVAISAPRESRRDCWRGRQTADAMRFRPLLRVKCSCNAFEPAVSYLDTLRQ